MFNYTRTKSRGQPVKNSRGCVVGKIVGDCLQKRARSSCHMLHKPLAWAWDADILFYAKAHGVEKIKIYDDDTNQVYSANITEFGIHGVIIERGFGTQIALPLPYWKVTDRSKSRTRTRGGKK